MGDNNQEITLPAPFAQAHIYNETKHLRLRGRIWFAAFRGECIHLALHRPLAEDALPELAIFLGVWWENEYSHIYFHLDRQIEAATLRTVLAANGVEIVPVEIEPVSDQPSPDSVDAASCSSLPRDTDNVAPNWLALALVESTLGSSESSNSVKQPTPVGLEFSDSSMSMSSSSSITADSTGGLR